MYLKNNNPVLYWTPVIGDVFGALLRARLLAGIASTASPKFATKTLFGVNIAPSSEPGCESYIVERLQELGIDHVRMNYTYASDDSAAQRLLLRVLAEGKQVLLNLIPPAEEAKKIEKDIEVAKQWRTFVASVFAQYRGKVEVFEIGSTPNRGRWSGFGHRGFLQAWQIASEEAALAGVELAGPNVSDFEPLFNLAFLAAMRRYSHLPTIHTDNLFVERVLEPEAYDHRAMGRWLANSLALNLIKKARILERIGRSFGVDETYCSYYAWTIKRLERRAADPAQKQADYLVRYSVLAAASSALGKVYWGPLICSRDGLISCGAEGYPRIDNVSFYKEVRGKLEDFHVRPAFHALRQTNAKLRDSVCVQAVNADNGIHHFVFTKDGKELHIVWCRDGKTFALSALYSPQMLQQAAVENCVGEALKYVPEVLSEQPLFFIFNSENASFRPAPEKIKAIASSSNVMQAAPNQQAVPVQLADWRGAIMLDNGASLESALARLAPENMQAKPVNRVLRDTRNRLWTIDDAPGDASAEQQLVVKLNRAKGSKKFTYRFMPSKGQRHWNNASYMQRCGVNTPPPLAYFERYNNSGVAENYYVCRYIDNTFSTRDVFNCFNQGEDNFRGFSKQDMFATIAEFIRNMHAQRIIHRDLSSGNLMMTINPAGNVDVFVIDIGRATVGIRNRLSSRQRCIDLMRICYKLDWSDRELFISHYDQQLDPGAVRGWRIPLFFYEAKQTLKKLMKGKYKRKVRRK